MDEFFRTRMGQTFFCQTLPDLVKQLGRVADAQVKQNELIEKQQEIIKADMEREEETTKLIQGETVSAEWVLNTLAGQSFPSSGAAYDFIKALLDKEKGASRG
jgi:hypothetical protein